MCSSLWHSATFFSFSYVLPKDLIETEASWVGTFVVLGLPSVCSHDTLLEGRPKGHPQTAASAQPLPAAPAGTSPMQSQGSPAARRPDSTVMKSPADRQECLINASTAPWGDA